MIVRMPRFAHDSFEFLASVAIFARRGHIKHSVLPEPVPVDTNNEIDVTQYSKLCMLVSLSVKSSSSSFGLALYNGHVELNDSRIDNRLECYVRNTGNKEKEILTMDIAEKEGSYYVGYYAYYINSASVYEIWLEK